MVRDMDVAADLGIYWSYGVELIIATGKDLLEYLIY
jgi:hypothetical protein